MNNNLFVIFSNLDICESCAKKLENWIEENTVN